MSDDELRAAAESGDINRLYSVIKEDPQVLERLDSIQFVETPLHIAASAGRIPFAAEMMRLKPSFALKLNPEGRCPIHLAQEGGYKRMALHFVHMNKDLVRAKMREGLTPLHLASQSGDVDLLTKFLEACPDSIEDETVFSETALHLAVKNQNFDALQYLVKLLVKKPTNLETAILNQEDEDGNTILHIAARNNDEQAIELLLKYTRYTICVDAKNLLHQTASDITGSQDIKWKLVQATPAHTMISKIGHWLIKFGLWMLVGKTSISGSMSDENLNAYLVVATLIATTTYQAALSPPGGLHQIDVPTNNNNTLTHSPSNSTILEGKSVLSDQKFIQFSSLNMFAFLASTLTILGLLSGNVARGILYLAMFYLIISYYISMTIISPNASTTNKLLVISIYAGVVVQYTLIYSTHYISFIKKIVYK